MLKEMIEKDEMISHLSLQVHELKAVLRQNETKEFEQKLKEIEKVSYDKSLFCYESNDLKVISNHGLRRSKSPFANDKTINETVMYGGGTSVLDSMIGSFPHDRTSILASQDFQTRKSKDESPTNILKIRDSSSDYITKMNILHSVKNSSERRKSNISNESQENCKTSRIMNLSKFKQVYY